MSAYPFSSRYSVIGSDDEWLVYDNVLGRKIAGPASWDDCHKLAEHMERGFRRSEQQNAADETDELEAPAVRDRSHLVTSPSGHSYGR